MEVLPRAPPLQQRKAVEHEGDDSDDLREPRSMNRLIQLPFQDELRRREKHHVLQMHVREARSSTSTSRDDIALISTHTRLGPVLAQQESKSHVSSKPFIACRGVPAAHWLYNEHEAVPLENKWDVQHDEHNSTTARHLAGASIRMHINHGRDRPV
ncbi:hypothetical protein M440DRAFT_1392217 [Trichoderma longibrachiatum ATCC 18648]|uniref:Uncharacterized protein n=1 Tax=Trichoderma longibrachiatum ATCC 18648 TaxID=983965 RepID=A0A2T4C289_TRILO|nr:hypothetical protein M440DRAFT_1392217 [Trichoderma longibrachiatum ATCC 18648]